MIESARLQKEGFSLGPIGELRDNIKHWTLCMCRYL